MHLPKLDHGEGFQWVVARKTSTLNLTRGATMKISQIIHEHGFLIRDSTRLQLREGTHC